jgi:hypothetical protein
MIEFNLHNNCINIRVDGAFIGSLKYRIYCGNETLLPLSIEVLDNNKIRVEFDRCVILDGVKTDDDALIINRLWEIKRAGKFALSFLFTPEINKPDEWIVPSVMYRQNALGEGKYPRGNWDMGWSFREDRIPIPSCAILTRDTRFNSVFAFPSRDCSDISSIKTYAYNGAPEFEIRIPFSEEPFTYTEKGIMLGGLTRKTGGLIKIRKRDIPYKYSRKFVIVLGQVSHYTEAIKKTFDTAWRVFDIVSPDLKGLDINRFIRLKLNHLRFLSVEKDKTAYIKMGEGNGFFQSYYEYTAASFLVKSLEAAVIFAQTRDKKNIELAEKIGEFFLQGRLDNGLHQDMYDIKRDVWGGYLGVGCDDSLKFGVNSRCNGETMINYLRLYSITRNKKFLDTAKANADFYLKNQLPDGGFGRWWTTDGEPVDTKGSNGAYIISMLIELEKVTGKDERVDSALERAGNYYLDFVDKGDFYADTLDADCVDKEAGVALLRAFLDLYERNPRDDYLCGAKRLASFILSWLWTYNTPFPKNTVCAKNDFQTLGMTAVSVAHHHLDFYGMMIARDFFRLAVATGDTEWKTYAMSMVRACFQLIADEDNLLGRDKRFAGWQPEQVNHTNWNYKHRLLGTKGTVDVCVAWTVVLTLGAVLDIIDKGFLE